MLNITNLYADYGGKPALEDIRRWTAVSCWWCWARPGAEKPRC